MISQDIFKSIRRIQILSSQLANDVLAGAYRSAFKGKGMEFEEVREYQPGDEIRSIDWNVTARMTHPYVKVFREERDLTVIFVVDVSASSRFGSHSGSKSALIAEIGGVLAFSAIKNNDKVGLILFSDTIEKYLPPRKGVRHVTRVIRELLAFQPQGRGTDLKAALAFLGKVQRRSGICFLISDFLAKDYSHEAALIAKRHDLISIRVSDPSESNFPKMGLTHVQGLESSDSALVDTNSESVIEKYQSTSEQHLMAFRQLMKKIGAGYIEIRTDQSYMAALRKFFKIREKKRR